MSTDATVLHKFGTGFSLGGGCYFVHVIQGDRVLIMFSLNLADIPWQSCPEELHLEELHPIVDKIVLPFCGAIRRFFISVLPAAAGVLYAYTEPPFTKDVVVTGALIFDTSN